MKSFDASISPGRASGTWALLESDRELANGTRWEELESSLRRLPCQASPGNAIAILLTPTGDTFSIGIAEPHEGDNPDLDEELASIEYNRADQEPPYLVAVGDPSMTFEDGGVVVFRFEGDWTEILKRNCVPVEKMLAIVNHFLEENELPDWIGWEQV
jgi:hypothetical protein